MCPQTNMRKKNERTRDQLTTLTELFGCACIEPYESSVRSTRFLEFHPELVLKVGDVGNKSLLQTRQG